MLRVGDIVDVLLPIHTSQQDLNVRLNRPRLIIQIAPEGFGCLRTESTIHCQVRILSSAFFPVE